MHTEGVKPERKTSAALAELLAICPVCGREGPALYESESGCCEQYLRSWFTRCAA